MVYTRRTETIMSNDQLESQLIERVEALEQSNKELSRRMVEADQSAKSWRAITLAIALTALFVPFAARIALFNPSTLDVVARSFTVRDDNGVKRASLFMAKEQFPVLAFYDDRGANVMNLAAGNDRTAGLYIFDNENQTRLMIAKSTGGQAGLKLFDTRNHKLQASLANDQNGNVGLKVSDEQGKLRVSAGVWGHGLSGLETRDDRGNVSFRNP